MLDTERVERKAHMEHATGREPQPPLPLPPLRVSGLVVSRADLVAALRAYLPLDGNRFLLSVTELAPE